SLRLKGRILTVGKPSQKVCSCAIPEKQDAAHYNHLFGLEVMSKVGTAQERIEPIELERCRYTADLLTRRRNCRGGRLYFSLKARIKWVGFLNPLSELTSFTFRSEVRRSFFAYSSRLTASHLPGVS